MTKDNTCAAFGAEILGDTQNALKEKPGTKPTLSIMPASHGGFLVMEDYHPGFIAPAPLFAGPLKDCLEFIERMMNPPLEIDAADITRTVTTPTETAEPSLEELMDQHRELGAYFAASIDLEGWVSLTLVKLRGVPKRYRSPPPGIMEMADAKRWLKDQLP